MRTPFCKLLTLYLLAELFNNNNKKYALLSIGFTLLYKRKYLHVVKKGFRGWSVEKKRKGIIR
jgi:hypothetical protein